MLLRTTSAILFTAAAAIGAQCAHGADWPQWRGPNRDGVSQETGLLAQWPENGPPLAWRVDDLGEGYSTPSVIGDRLYVMSNKGEADEFVEARAVKDGSQLWSVRVGNVGANQGPQYPGARSTPTVDGQLLYALGSDGDLACLERATGKIRWSKNMKTDFGGKRGMWAYAESPLVDGDKLICTPGGEEATLLALDKKSGDVIWKSAVPGGDQAAYASVIVVETNGVKQYVQFLQNGLVGVDAATGKFLWRYKRTAQGSPANIPSPIASDGIVYSASGKGGGAAVTLKVSGDGVEAEEVYFSRALPTAIGGAVLVDGNMYGTTGQSTVCVDFKSGDIKWQERGLGAGAVLYADGRLYIHGENGNVALVEATPEAYRERGRFTPVDQPKRGQREAAWAYPVVANGRLYIRDKNVLWSYNVQGASNVQ